MRFTVFVMLCWPFLSLAQNKVEEVQLKSGKTAVLYDNGLWIYKDVSPMDSKPALTGNLRTVNQLSSLTNIKGTHILLIPSGDTVTILRKHDANLWAINYRGQTGYIKNIFLNASRSPTTSSPLYQPASTPGSSSSSQTSSPCGARTKTTGAPCKRLVKGGGYCYQHI